MAWELAGGVGWGRGGGENVGGLSAIEQSRDSKLVIKLDYLATKLVKIVDKKVS